MRAFALVCLLLVVGSLPAEALTSEPRRVVSIGGAITEIVFALGAGPEDPGPRGAGHEVVAVDSTSRWPAAVESLPDIGYLRRLSAEPIIAMAPDLVLASADSGPEAVLDQLRAAGLNLIIIPDDPSIEGIYAKVEAVARALDREPAGATLIAEIEDGFRAARRAVPAYGVPPRVLFVMTAGRGAVQAAGAATAADAIIRLAGGSNAIDGYAGYKPLAPEAAIAAAPDVVLTMQQTLDALGGADALRARPELALTPAGRAGRVLALDGLLLLGFGPRTPAAVAELAAGLKAIARPDALLDDRERVDG